MVCIHPLLNAYRIGQREGLVQCSRRPSRGKQQKKSHPSWVVCSRWLGSDVNVFERVRDKSDGKWWRERCSFHRKLANNTHMHTETTGVYAQTAKILQTHTLAHSRIMLDFWYIGEWSVNNETKKNPWTQEKRKKNTRAHTHRDMGVKISGSLIQQHASSRMQNRSYFNGTSRDK